MAAVKIAELKAHLSEYLRKVRRGHSITVMDRETPIARLVPYEAQSPLVIRKRTGDIRSFRPLPPLKLKVDSLSVLMEQRQHHR